MAIAKMPQIDLTPATPGNTTGIHFHGTAGQAASAFNNMTDFPNTTPAATSPADGKTVSVKIPGTQGQTVRFSNPS